MLKIYMGELEDRVLHNVDVYFNNQMRVEWLETDFAREVIKDIDKSDLISPFNVLSPYLGSIPTTKISGGTKALFLMKFQSERIVNATNCGDNCAKWILKIAEEKEKAGEDLLITLEYLMDFGKNPFRAVIVNNGVEVHNMREFVYNAGDFI